MHVLGTEAQFLAQVQVSSTSITTLFSAPAENKVEITRIFAFTTSGSPAYELLYSDTGAPSASNLIYQKIGSNTSDVLGAGADSFGLSMSPSSTLAARMSAGSQSVIFTIFGIPQNMAAVLQRSL